FRFAVPRQNTSLRSLVNLGDTSQQQSQEYSTTRSAENSIVLRDEEDDPFPLPPPPPPHPAYERLGFVRDCRLGQIEEETEPSSTSMDDASRLEEQPQPGSTTSFPSSNDPPSIPFAQPTPVLDCDNRLQRIRSTPQFTNQSLPEPGSVSLARTPQQASIDPDHPTQSDCTTQDHSSRLFRFTYDTFARRHLSRLVDEIEGLSLRSASALLGQYPSLKLKSVLGSPGEEVTDQSSSIGLAHSTPPGMIFGSGINERRRVSDAGRTPFRQVTTNLTKRWNEEKSWKDSFVEPSPYALQSLSLSKRKRNFRRDEGSQISDDDTQVGNRSSPYRTSSKRIRLHQDRTPSRTLGAFNNRALKDSVKITNERKCKRRLGLANAHPMVIFRSSGNPRPQTITEHSQTDLPPTQPIVVRDRLAEAKALMDRIRAKPGPLQEDTQNDLSTGDLSCCSDSKVLDPQQEDVVVLQNSFLSNRFSSGVDSLALNAQEKSTKVSVPGGGTDQEVEDDEDDGYEMVNGQEFAVEDRDLSSLTKYDKEEGFDEIFDTDDRGQPMSEEGQGQDPEFTWAIDNDQDCVEGDREESEEDEETMSETGEDHNRAGPYVDHNSHDNNFEESQPRSDAHQFDSVQKRLASDAASSIRQALSDVPHRNHNEGYNRRYDSAGHLTRYDGLGHPLPKRQFATQPVSRESTNRGGSDFNHRFTGSNRLSSVSTAVSTTTSAANPTNKNSLNTTNHPSGKLGLMTIAPRDVEDLLQNARVGRMVFDSTSGKWVKARSQSENVGLTFELEEFGAEKEVGDSSSDEEDIFKDIESFNSKREGESSSSAVSTGDLKSNNNRIRGRGLDSVRVIEQPTITDHESFKNLSVRSVRKDDRLGTVLVSRKDSNVSNLPKSVLKATDSPTADESNSCLIKHSRSVSFQDGRKNGKIVGLDDDLEESEQTTTTRGKPIEKIKSKSYGDLHQSGQSSVILTSSTKKVRRKASSNNGNISNLLSINNHHTSNTTMMMGTSNGNSLTTGTSECSFGLNYERLIKLISDLEPFEPYWSSIKVIDLSSRRLESVVRLKEILPLLDQIDLHCNQLNYLNGLPESIRMLLVSDNRLNDLSSFGHLKNLERLDLSKNFLTSLQQLVGLKHLRELKIEDNLIEDLSSLNQLDGLIKLSLKGNKLKRIRFDSINWSQLEVLNLDRNQIVEITGLHNLKSLYTLNLDRNQLYSLEIQEPMPSLRVLRLSENRLEKLDVSKLINLRTLYIDNNDLLEIVGAHRLRKLENLSARDQRGSELSLPMRQVRDVRRMYLGGNPLPITFPTCQFYNLIYLELAMCQCEKLPSNLSEQIPNIRTINLNYNFLQDLSPLSNLLRLEKLTVVGSRIKSVDKGLIRLLESLPELELLDLRQNPLTSSFYPPLLLSSSTSTPSKNRTDKRSPHMNQYQIVTSSSSDWSVIDDRFRKSLPKQFYLRRMTYRSIVMRSCRRLKMFDGIKVGENERKKMTKFLRSLSRKLDSNSHSDSTNHQGGDDDEEEEEEEEEEEDQQRGEQE
ncbi:hypothetical protein BY996DRAFT_4591942, partial [Phakopsora pachyrhizi]